VWLRSFDALALQEQYALHLIGSLIVRTHPPARGGRKKGRWIMPSAARVGD
jgi:hypothetical protein